MVIAEAQRSATHHRVCTTRAFALPPRSLVPWNAPVTRSYRDTSCGARSQTRESLCPHSAKGPDNKILRWRVAMLAL